ncbi:MAG TPA: CehA/McbA family metallohydrolase [Gemmata sp.]|nr:CehA/McbA family metallohydrolase [Gemmata sp.]
MRTRFQYHWHLSIAVCFIASAPALAGPKVIDGRLHHLRVGIEREWSDFPDTAEGANLTIKFQASKNGGEQTLRLRQQDVKQTWRVLLNGKELGRLLPDENDQELVLPIPVGGLIEGENRLSIEQIGRTPDDIRVGELVLHDRPTREVFAEAKAEVVVREELPNGERLPIPCRLTIQANAGNLATVGASSTDRLAVRAGVVYTADGTARFGLHAGDYTIHAGRGFAYGVSTVQVSVKAGDSIRKELTIRREVPLPGFVSCDTHVHNLTHSGHGDASDIERAITIAGEGIDLAIATDHNKQVDYSGAAEKAGVRKYFTPVVGNEVTTNVGHFNVFPLPKGGPVPDYRAKDWQGVAQALGKPTPPRMVILNHPRDLHAGFRPFGPEHHLALTGENLDGWDLPANAMEVVNSGALQTDAMRLVRDWFGMLNRGIFLAPVGASDSHDVSRYIVGQGRTYIRCKGNSPGEIDVSKAIESFAEGHVLVSCGLLTDIAIDGKFGPGDLVTGKGDIAVAVRVLGPAWTKADRVELFMNDVKVREAAIEDKGKAGEKWSGSWVLPRPRHDVHIAAVATGPGMNKLFWPIAKPYQPTSTIVSKRAIGLTGAVWIDGDGDGRRTSAREYARKLIEDAGGDWGKVLPMLTDYDEAVAAQVAGLLRVRGISPSDKDVRKAASEAGEHVLRGFDAYAEAWRENQVAREDARKK